MKFLSSFRGRSKIRPLAVLIGFVSLSPFLGPIAPKAEAALVDAWMTKKLVVQQSFVTSADGTRTPIPMDKELLVEIRLSTAASYGSPDTRLVKSKSVTDDVIELQIETSSEKTCRKTQGGMLAMMGPHSVDLRLALPPRDYKLVIDGSLTGLLRINETQSQFIPNPEYLADHATNSAKAFDALLGGLTALPKISGEHGCTARIEQEGTKLFLNYEFPKREVTLNNGDILIKKQRDGRVEIRNYDIRTRCDDGELYYDVEFLSPRVAGGAEPKMSFRIQGRTPGVFTNLNFRAGDDLSCYQK